MRRYKIYNCEKVLVDEFVCSNIIDEKFLQLKYDNHNIYKSCCFTEGNEDVRMQFFLEIKKEPYSLDDLFEVKTETIRVIDFIAKEFDIKVEYIRIYFNGSNGFYIVVPNVALGLYDMNKNDIYLKIKYIVKYIKEKTMCEYIVTENYGIDLMHLEFETLNVNTKLYTHRISRDNLDRYNVQELLSYFSDTQRKGFRLGVKEFRDQPEGKLKEIIDSYMSSYSEEGLAFAKESFFNINKSKNINTSENLETFKMKLANNHDYNLGNNFLLYMYNTMLNEIKRCSKQDVPCFKIGWITRMIIDFLTMTNGDKELGVVEDHRDFYIFNRINGITEYIMQLNINNYLLENNETIISICYDDTKSFGRYDIPESEFEFENIIMILSSIDFILNG